MRKLQAIKEIKKAPSLEAIPMDSNENMIGCFRMTLLFDFPLALTTI